MKVFNPGRGPVTVDDGALVPGGEQADVPDGPRVRRALEARTLIVPGGEYEADSTIEPPATSDDAKPRQQKAGGSR